MKRCSPNEAGISQAGKALIDRGGVGKYAGMRDAWGVFKICAAVVTAGCQFAGSNLQAQGVVEWMPGGSPALCEEPEARDIIGYYLHQGAGMLRSLTDGPGVSRDAEWHVVPMTYEWVSDNNPFLLPYLLEDSYCPPTTDATGSVSTTGSPIEFNREITSGGGPFPPLPPSPFAPQVPEPGTWAMLLLGGAVLLVGRR